MSPLIGLAEKCILADRLAPHGNSEQPNEIAYPFRFHTCYRCFTRLGSPSDRPQRVRSGETKV